ncbi:MAG: PQQ-binding-like beta-propeller repeat protein [Prevotellaceae bacterium]|nr:PQQ-binding-like beta-propeller repeat protein [Candidatus Minthosoma equi]
MRKVYRNIAIVTAVFMLVLVAMLGVSYYQMQQVSPLQTEVIETLKELNEGNADNESLQLQIRQLDLISRKAYFVQEGQLKTGIYILLGMALVLIVSLNMYFKESMNLPEKELDPIDEWMTKSRSRKYITWASSIAAVAVLAIVILQNLNFKKSGDVLGGEAEEELLAENAEGDGEASGDVTAADSVQTEETADSVATAEDDGLPIPKITSNAFRGNNSSAMSSAKGIATSWDLKSKKNILWQASVPKHGYNSPVINGRNVFVTGADNAARELYCFDIYTGELKWTVKADKIPGSPSSMPKVNADTGLAASTVATNGQQVCAIFATGDVICADMEGKRLWAKNLGLPDNHYGYASSLLMYGNELIIQYENNSNGKVLALNAANGNQLWSKSVKDKIAWSSPIIATLGGKPALVVMGNPAITAYSLSNGAELWRVECMSGEVGSSPAASNGVVFGASEYAKCIAIDGATGETLWEASDYLPECSSLAATSNLVFCATSYGMVCAYDAKTGAVTKEHDLSTPFYSSPVVADGKVFLFSNSGKAYIFSASDFSLITSFETGEKTFATPAFSDGMMVVRTDKSIYCVKKS